MGEIDPVNDPNPVVHASEAINRARDYQRDGDVWSAGFEIARAHNWLEEVPSDWMSRLAEAEEMAEEWSAMESKLAEMEAELAEKEGIDVEAFRQGRNFAISRILNHPAVEESDIRHVDVGEAVELSQGQISRIRHQTWEKLEGVP